MLVNNKNQCLGFLLLLYYSLPVCSESWHGYAGASLSASYGRLGHHSPVISYFSGTTITDAYPLDKNHASAAEASVNLGFEWNRSPKQPAVALGLGYYGNLSPYHFHGRLVETAAGDPSSALYRYREAVNSTRLLAEMQLTWACRWVSPFLQLGVGPAWNRMSDYSEKAITPNGYPPLQPFQSHRHTSAAYQVGLGLSNDFHLSGSKADFPTERIALGYRYAYLGKTAFDTRGLSYPYRLQTGPMQTNALTLAYTHLF